MFDFKEERNKHNITLRQLEELAEVDFCEVYRFDNQGFVLMTVADMEKIVKAFSTLTNHPYVLSDFFLPPDNHTPLNSSILALGVRGGTGSLPLTQRLLHDTERMQQWAKTQQQTPHPAPHRPNPNTQDRWKTGRNEHE